MRSEEYPTESVDSAVAADIAVAMRKISSMLMSFDNYYCIW